MIDREGKEEKIDYYQLALEHEKKKHDYLSQHKLKEAEQENLFFLKNLRKSIEEDSPEALTKMANLSNSPSNDSKNLAIHAHGVLMGLNPSQSPLEGVRIMASIEENSYRSRESFWAQKRLIALGKEKELIENLDSHQFYERAFLLEEKEGNPKRLSEKMKKEYLSLLQAAANLGHLEALLTLGKLFNQSYDFITGEYLIGDKLKRNQQYAINLFLQAYELVYADRQKYINPEAIYELALLFWEMRLEYCRCLLCQNQNKIEVKEISFYRSEDNKSQKRQGSYCPEKIKSLDLLQTAANLKHTEALLKLGEIYYDEPDFIRYYFSSSSDLEFKESREQALKLYMKAHELGSAEASLRLGDIYNPLPIGQCRNYATLTSYEIELKNAEKCIYFYEKAVQQQRQNSKNSKITNILAERLKIVTLLKNSKSDAKAQYSISELYETRLVSLFYTERNKPLDEIKFSGEEFLKWLDSAKSQNYPPALYTMATLYLTQFSSRRIQQLFDMKTDDRVLPHRNMIGISFLIAASNAHFVPALLLLGRIYSPENSLRIVSHPKDKHLATYFLEKAANTLKSPAEIEQLGMEGLGCPEFETVRNAMNAMDELDSLDKGGKWKNLSDYYRSCHLSCYGLLDRLLDEKDNFFQVGFSTQKREMLATKLFSSQIGRKEIAFQDPFRDSCSDYPKYKKIVAEKDIVTLGIYLITRVGIHSRDRKNLFPYEKASDQLVFLDLLNDFYILIKKKDKQCLVRDYFNHEYNGFRYYSDALDYHFRNLERGLDLINSEAAVIIITQYNLAFSQKFTQPIAKTIATNVPQLHNEITEIITTYVHVQGQFARFFFFDTKKHKASSIPDDHAPRNMSI